MLSRAARILFYFYPTVCAPWRDASNGDRMLIRESMPVAGASEPP